MADFYFFTDLDRLDVQPPCNLTLPAQGITGATPAFSPSAFSSFGNGSSEAGVLVSSMHTSVLGANAYAICDGQVVACPILNTNLFNIILKPDVQPASSHGLPRIKYFIYRGILVDPFFTRNGTTYTIKGPPTAPSTSDLFLSWWFDTPDPAHRPAGAPVLNDLSWDIINDSLNSNGVGYYLDYVFNNPNITDGAASKWQVKGGWILGQFPASTNPGAHLFGLDILIDNPRFNPRTSLVCRNVNASGVGKIHLANVSNYISGQPPKNVYNNVSITDADVRTANAMEEILSYIDPCAFYASFITPSIDNVYARNNGTTNGSSNLGAASVTVRQLTFGSGAGAITQPAIGFYSLQNNDVYQYILQGANSGSNFANRNRVYIDIRDNFNDSYNLHRDRNLIGNGNNISVGYEKNTVGMTPTDYNTYFPLLIMDQTNTVAAAFTVSSDFTVDANTTATLLLQFPVADPSLEEYSLFCMNNQSFDLYSSNNGGNNQLRLGNANANYINYLPFDSTNTGLTSAVGLHVPVCQVSGTNYIACSHFRMMFIKHQVKVDDPIINTTANPAQTSQQAYPASFQNLEYLDNIFPLSMIVDYPVKDANPFPTAGSGTSTLNNVTFQNPPGDGRIRTNVYQDCAYVDNMRAGGVDFVGHMGISKASNGNVTLFVAGRYGRASVPAPIFRNLAAAAIGAGGNDCGSLALERVNFDRGRTFYGNLELDYGNKPLLFEQTGTPSGFPCLAINDFTDPPNGLPVVNQPDYFVAINIAANDYSSIQNQYSQLITTSDPNPGNSLFMATPPNFRASLAFSFVSVTAGSVKYEVLIKYYLVGQVPGHSYDPKVMSTGVFVYVDAKSLDYDTYDSEHKTIHNETAVGGTRGFLYQLNPTPPLVMHNLQQITADMYFMRDMLMNRQDFLDRLKYIKGNIEKVFNTANINTFDQTGTTFPLATSLGAANIGLLAAAMSHPSRGLNDPISNYAISTLVNLKMAIPPKIKGLMGTETLSGVYFTNPNPWGANRSHIAFQRFGLFILPNINYADNAPAHEFGHVMGLADRYAYGSVVNGTTVTAGTFSPVVYVGSDPEYQVNYCWLHNLMTFHNHVPASNGLYGSLPEKSYIERYWNYGPQGFGNDLDLITVFITPAQWNAIRTNTPEQDSAFHDKEVYFTQITPDATITHIVGMSNPATLVSDLSYAPVKAVAGYTPPNPGVPADPTAGDMSVRTSGASLLSGHLRVSDNILTIYTQPGVQRDLLNGGLNTVQNGLTAGTWAGPTDLIANDLFDALRPNGPLIFVDPGGATIWNLSDSSATNLPVGGTNIRYTNFINRIQVVTQSALGGN